MLARVELERAAVELLGQELVGREHPHVAHVVAGVVDDGKDHRRDRLTHRFEKLGALGADLLGTRFVGAASSEEFRRESRPTCFHFTLAGSVRRGTGFGVRPRCAGQEGDERRAPRGERQN